MNITQLFTDETAVSPVIGIILMVAITVILGATVGSVVLSMSGELQDDTPQIATDFEYSGGSVTVYHNGGDDVSASDLSVSETGSSDGVSVTGSGTISAGDEIANGSVESDETIRIVWSDGEQSATIATSTAP